MHTVKENVEALVGASKETGLEVNADGKRAYYKGKCRSFGRG